MKLKITETITAHTDAVQIENGVKWWRWAFTRHSKTTATHLFIKWLPEPVQPDFTHIENWLRSA